MGIKSSSLHTSGERFLQTLLLRTQMLREQRDPNSACYLRERCSISGHESFLSSSEYILNKMRSIQAKLDVSCFNKLGLDFPLKPVEKTVKRQLIRYYSKHPLIRAYMIQSLAKQVPLASTEQGKNRETAESYFEKTKASELNSYV